jgi:hypothetical protein
MLDLPVEDNHRKPIAHDHRTAAIRSPETNGGGIANFANGEYSQALSRAISSPGAAKS